MKWHLVNPLGHSERVTDADSLFWAKRRLAPLPKGWHVISDASYQTPAYQVKPELIDLCSKCLRYPAEAGYAQCTTCKTAKREAYKPRGTRGKSAKSPTRAESLRRFHDQETPEQKEARRERMRQARNVDIRSRDGKMRARDASIRNGIARRRAKRETQLSLGF